MVTPDGLSCLWATIILMFVHCSRQLILLHFIMSLLLLSSAEIQILSFFCFHFYFPAQHRNFYHPLQSVVILCVNPSLWPKQILQNLIRSLSSPLPTLDSSISVQDLKHKERCGASRVASWQHPLGQGHNLSKLHVFFVTFNDAFYTLTFLMLNLFQ